MTTEQARNAAATGAEARRELPRTLTRFGLSVGLAPVRARQSITVNRSPEETYRFWRNLEALPRFMTHLESIEVIDDRRSRWTVAGPADTPISWEAEIVDDRAGELISWRSVPGSDIEHAGTVRFIPAPGGRGTEVHAELVYRAPAGSAARRLARLFRRAPDQVVRDELRAMKQVLETGDLVRSDASRVRGMHPARPAQARRAS